MTTDTGGEASLWPKAGELGDKALACTFEAFKRMPDVFILAVCLVFALDIAGGCLAGRFDLLGSALHDWSQRQSYAIQFFVFLGIWLAHFFVIAAVAVAVHRFILLQETTSGFEPLVHRYAWTFAAWLFGFGVLAAVASLPLPLRLRLLALVPLLIVELRFALLFPAVAIGSAYGGVFEQLRVSWRRTQGRLLTLFYASIVAVLPFFAVAMGLLLVELAVWALAGAMHLADSSVVTDLLMSLITSGCRVAGAVCAAAVASLAYRAALEVERAA